MISAALPANETQRLAELRRYDILDTSAEEFYDRLTQLAARACDVPIALVSLVDADRQWFKSRVGLEASETPRDLAFCAHAILERGPFVVPDATLDARFADNPLVTGAPGVRFYAGVPLVTPTNLALGTLCVIDRKPRTLETRQLTMLTLIAEQVSRELELRLVATGLERKSVLLLKTQKVAGIGGWSMDLRTRAVFWTDEMYHIHGMMPRAQAPTLDEQLAIYDPASAVALRATIEEAAVQGTPFDLELSLTCTEGGVRWLRATVEAQMDTAGVRELIGVFHDITDRKSDDLTLKRTTERLAIATSAVVGLGMWDWTLWDNQMYWDAQMYQIYRHASSGATVPYALWAERLHPDDRAQTEETFVRAVATIGTVDTVYRIVLPDGATRIIRTVAQTVQEPGNDRKRMLGFDQDITESRREQQASEAMLKASEHKFRTLFEMSPIGKALVDMDSGRILQANSALHRSGCCATTRSTPSRLIAPLSATCPETRMCWQSFTPQST